MTQSTILNRYGKRFGNQESRETRHIEVVSNSVDDICKKYIEWASQEKGGDNIAYFSTLDYLKDIKPTSKDISDFSFRLRRCGIIEPFGINGMFLSALIEISPDENFDVFTEDFPEMMSAFGYRNRKKVHVYGNLGGWTGTGMTGGEIVVSGNIWDYAGYMMKGGTIKIEGNATNGVGCKMEGGEIEVQGNARDYVGQLMSGGLITIDGSVRYHLGDNMKTGRIIVKGNAEDNIGHSMKGGEVKIFGNLGTISDDWKRGCIYHKGELVRAGLIDGALNFFGKLFRGAEK